MTPEALAELHARAFTAQRPWTAQEFADLLSSPLVFVVSMPHAFALGRAITEEAELLTLATDPDYRRAGLGREMLLSYERTAAARGANRSFLEVAADNKPAITLYETAGYTHEGRRPAYYTTPDGAKVDAVLMARALPLG